MVMPNQDTFMPEISGYMMGTLLKEPAQNGVVEIRLREDFRFKDPELESNMKMANEKVYKGNGLFLLHANDMIDLAVRTTQSNERQP